MKSYIIGIAGELNSGKDTLASMINYIFAVGTTKAQFSEWATKKFHYDKTFGDRITHFADPMKDCLSIMYNIPREHFDSREHKDELWYSLEERIFLSDRESTYSGYTGIDIKSLERYSLQFILKDISFKGKKPLIRLRTLMQYFGTEIGRKMLGDLLWTNATIGKAADIAEGRKLCIIPDLRFANERDGIRGNFLYGGDILINRDQVNKSDHSSETIDFTCKFNIDNNGTRMGLFYNALKIVNIILKN